MLPPELIQTRKPSAAGAGVNTKLRFWENSVGPHVAMPTSSPPKDWARHHCSCPGSGQKHRLRYISPHIITIRCWLFVLACCRRRGGIHYVGWISCMTSHIISTLPWEKSVGLMEAVCCFSVEKDSFSGMKFHRGLDRAGLIKTRFLPKHCRNWLNCI